MSVATDLRHAARSLRNAPGFTAATVLTLALGIGANATMFGLVGRLMLSAPPHVRDAGRVVQVGISFSGRPGERFVATTTSYPVFTDLRDGVKSLAAVAATATSQMVLGTGADAHVVSGNKVSGNFFSLLGASPFLGRFFGEAEDLPPTGIPFAVLSYAFWQREFAGDRAVVGRVIALSDAQYTVVGVAPPDFNGDLLQPVDVWVPLHAGMVGQGSWETVRSMNLVAILARLRDGANANLAAQEATLAFRRAATGFVAADSSSRIELKSLVPSIADKFSSQGQIALWLAAMSAIVFVVAIANVTNLVLVRTVRRRREIAVRLALGAGRWRLIRQLTSEGVLLAMTGGALALLLAGWGSEVVRALLLPGLSGTSSFLPLAIVEVTFVATALALIFTSLVPAVRASRPSLVADLKEGAGAIGHHRSRVLSTLLVLQSALAVLLLTGAGLFVRSLHRVEAQDFGFSSENVYRASMEFTAGSVAGPIQDQLYHQAEEVVRRIPGVTLTSLVQVTPFDGRFNVPPISVPGLDDFPSPRKQLPALSVATPTYFKLLGMHLVAGRNFNAADGVASQLVVIINDEMARGLWPGQSAIGKCIRVGFGDQPPSGPAAPPSAPCREVVGVVSTARRRSIREEAEQQARMQYYVPFGQLPAPPSFVHQQNGEVWGILVKTNGSAATPGLVRRAMQSFAPNLPFTEIQSLQSLLDRQMQPWLLGAAMFSVFGALALLLAALGLYSVRAYSVAQRRREMGVRMAMGAQSSDIVQLVVVEGLKIFSMGLLVGLAGVLVGGRFIEPLLFNVSSRDGVVLATVTTLLLAIAIVANAVPALRASRVPLSRALKLE